MRGLKPWITGGFLGVNVSWQPCRRKRRSGCKDSPRNRAVPWGTGAVPQRIPEWYQRPYIVVFSTIFPYYAVRRCHTFGLQHKNQQPGSGHGQRPAGGEANVSHSGLYGRRASWEHGDWRPRQAPELHRPQPRQARCPPSRGLKPDRALSRFLRRGAENPTGSRRRLSAGFPAHLQEHFPEPSCGLVPGVRETGGNQALPAGATRATTLTSPLLSAVV